MGKSLAANINILQTNNTLVLIEICTHITYLLGKVAEIGQNIHYILKIKFIKLLTGNANLAFRTLMSNKENGKVT